jgi:hypothetical protein
MKEYNDFEDVVKAIQQENIAPVNFKQTDQVLLEDGDYTEWTHALSVLGEDLEVLSIVTSEDFTYENYEAIQKFADANPKLLNKVYNSTEGEMSWFRYKGIPVVICHNGPVDCVILAANKVHDIFGENYDI